MNRKTIIENNMTGDSCIYVKHKSGLDIYICEMSGFSTVEALFGTRYGSVNTTFRTASEKEYTTVPEGIAHFLEHKLFENKECGAFELYSRTGAYGNAYTSFEKTCYLFNCTKHYRENLRILLDFVQKPYFTQETVDKEQGIIAQEIKMTEDDPNGRVFFNMMKCMYHNHPVKTCVAGTVESIAKIDAPLLYKCYNAFYNLNNMVLSIAGNVKADEVLEICDELLRPCENNGLETLFPEEPEEIVSPEIYEKQPIGVPIFCMGFKCRPCNGHERMKKTAAASIAAALLSDASSGMYNDLLSRGIINSTFGGELFNGNGYFTVMFSGESSDARAVECAVKAELERWKVSGICERDFQRIKKSAYGMLIRKFNDVCEVASIMLDGAMENISPYESIAVLSELTSEDVLTFAEEELCPDRIVLSVIEGGENL